MSSDPTPGEKRLLPDCPLGILENGEPAFVQASAVFGRGLGLLVGMPGAFTPVCSQHHLPGLIARRPRLRELGVDTVAVVTNDNPWVLDRWRAEHPEAGDILFLSDANEALLRALGLSTRMADLSLGTVASRFTAVVRDMVIEDLTVESDPRQLMCTAADAAVERLQPRAA